MSTKIKGNDSVRLDGEGADRDLSGIAAAYVSVDGAATPTIFDSENVTSLTDNGVGIYQVNLTQNMAASDYSTSVGPNASGANTVAYLRLVGSFTLLQTVTTTGAASDTDCSAVAHGDLSS